MDVARKWTLRSWWLSTELRRHRERAGFTIAEVQRRTGISRAALTRTESGDTTPHPRNLRDLLDLYAVRGAELALLLEIASQPDANGWWQSYRDVLPEDYGIYISFEAQAAQVLDYETSFIPGLLQTEAYAQAVIDGTVPGISADEVGRRASVRLQRQSALAGEAPLVLHVILDEAAVRRVVGGAAVMREQLRALADEQRDNVTIQVVPLAAGAHPGMGGSFSLLRFRHPRAPLAVSIETGAGQLLVDQDADVDRYTQMWERLAELALSPEDSARLIADAARKVR